MVTSPWSSLNHFNPNIWLLILSSSCYTFLCTLVTRIRCLIMITTSTVPLKGKLTVPRTSIISRIEAWVEFQDVRVEYWDLRFETLEVRIQRSFRAITFSNDLKFLTFKLNHGLKIRIACIVSDRAKLCSKYNTRVVLWLFIFLLCAWPSSLPRAKLCSKFKCSSDFFGQQPRRYYYLYCMRNPLCYLAPDRYYLSRCWKASLLLRHVRNFLSLHISSFIV